ncbi:glycosyltransferase [candidate division GN15 bacterium]|nr:glycosyltransferase [candidate division GN15 bacterium]
MRDLFLVGYFFLLFYIAFYGAHLYWLIRLYLKHRHERYPTPPPADKLPVVTVQLPIYNERYVVTRLIRSITAFDWPKDRLEIQVLDDSDDDTSTRAADEVARWQAEGFDIHHIRRSHRTGFKAGALADGMTSARGEFVAIFDADNVPHPDFLNKTIPHFQNDRIGLVQARWSFLNRDESLLCRAQALFLDSHFYIEQAARSRGGLFMNFNGTAGVWRAAAITEAGGWQSDTLTEDLDLSYRAQMAGWRMRFLEDVEVPTELPSSIRAFKAQQFRWTKGAIETGRKVLGKLIRSDQPVRIKLASCWHLTQKTIALALLLLSIMLVPALYIRAEGGMLKLLLIDLPIFLLGTGSMSLFYSLAYRRSKQAGTAITNLVLPVLTSIGIALSVNNSLAIIAALTGRHKSFVRTPKTGTTGRLALSLSSDYRVPFDLSVRAELFFACYAFGAILLAMVTGLYMSVPYLTTFAVGFTFFSYLSLRERYV